MISGMPRLSIQQLSRDLHKAGGLLLRSAGFRLSLVGEGPCKIGVWKKTLKSGVIESPRRFLLVPGFSDSPVTWLPALTMTRRSFYLHYDEIVMIDFPGYHGYLYDEPCFSSADALVSTLLVAFDQIKPHTIMGHSLGGGLAAYYSGIRGRVGSDLAPKSLVLISPSGVYTTAELRKQVETRILQIIENGIECLGELGPRLVQGDPNFFRKFLNEFFRFSSQKEIRSFVQSFGDDYLLEPLLEHIPSDVKLIWGSQDTLIPPSVVPLWLEGLPKKNVETIYLEGIGHAPQLEAPARLARTLGHLLT